VVLFGKPANRSTMRGLPLIRECRFALAIDLDQLRASRGGAAPWFGSIAIVQLPSETASNIAQRGAGLSGCSCHYVSSHKNMRPLDKNELEALKLFANGKTAEEIASALAVSQSMANHYLRIAARKLGARNRAYAVAIAVSTGLVDVMRGRE
jgi:DNA-binding CsgD family transcriptional regulator